MKIRTAEECPAVGARMLKIFDAISGTVTDEDEPGWDDSVELSALTALLTQFWCVAKDIEPEPDLVNGLGHTIAHAMANYTREYQNAPRN